MTAKLSLGDSKTRVSRRIHGTVNGGEVQSFTLRNAAGWEVEVSEYGATLLRVEVPDQSGSLANVCFGYPLLEDYQSDALYAGRVIGRLANRIEKGCFKVDGQEFRIPPNHGAHVLHGGSDGLHQALFQGEVIEGVDGEGVCLRYQSKDGEGGFPGGVTVEIHVHWKADGTLSFEMKAIPDRKTPLNFTHHPYWNLTGDFEQLVDEHQLQIVSSDYAVVDDELIPTGEKASCRLTPMDFRFRRSVGHAIPLLEGSGYDHCLFLDREKEGLMQAAHLMDAESGRNMTIWTNQPGMQLYTTPSLPGSSGGAICLEPQAAPGALHHPDLGSLMVDAGETYVHKTLYCFFATGR